MRLYYIKLIVLVLFEYILLILLNFQNKIKIVDRIIF